MLSIVIPYYKLTFFEETIKSLSNQTDQRFKVYIGDDASPEDPSSLLEMYASKFDCSYYKFKTNLGGTSLVKQWERCMQLTKDEEWMMILGDDDVLGNNCIAAFYQNLEEIENLKISTVRFSTMVIDSNGEFISKNYIHPKIEMATDFLTRKFKGGTRSSLSEYIFKRKSIETFRFKDFPLAWNSDLLAVLEFSEWKNIFTINEAQVFFRLSGLNITSKNDNVVLKNIATFNFYYYLLLKKNTYFNNEQKEKLYLMLEKTFLDNKKQVIFWLSLTKLYVVRIQVKRYLNFIKKIIVSTFNKV
jgi:glycosyltransferase involved in cell wall biosynthesis